MAKKNTNVFDMAVGAGSDFVETVKSASKKKQEEEEEDE
jgi:hypothetical protein